MKLLYGNSTNVHTEKTRVTHKVWKIYEYGFLFSSVSAIIEAKEM